MQRALTRESQKVRITLNEREFTGLVSAHALIGEIIETYEVLRNREIMKRIKKGEKAIREGEVIEIDDFLKLTDR